MMTDGKIGLYGVRNGKFVNGFTHSDSDVGEPVTEDLESAKWYLWHGNVPRALDKIENCAAGRNV